MEFFRPFGRTIKESNEKNKKKLTFLANELDGVGKTVEAHIVRTIVKPYIRDMNLKWSKMMALEQINFVYENGGEPDPIPEDW